MTRPLDSGMVIEIACGETLVLQPHGEIDLATVGEFDTALTHAVREPWRTVAVDLAEVSFLGLVGSHPIERAVRALRGGRRRIIVTRPSSHARWLLEWLGLGESIVATDQLPPVLRQAFDQQRSDPGSHHGSGNVEPGSARTAAGWPSADASEPQPAMDKPVPVRA